MPIEEIFSYSAAYFLLAGTSLFWIILIVLQFVMSIVLIVCVLPLFLIPLFTVHAGISITFGLLLLSDLLFLPKLLLDFGKANEIAAIMIGSLSIYSFYLKINQRMSTLESWAFMLGRLIRLLIQPIKKLRKRG